MMMNLQTVKRFYSLLLDFDSGRKNQTRKSDREMPETFDICMDIHKTEYKLTPIQHHTKRKTDRFHSWHRIAPVEQIKMRITE